MNSISSPSRRAFLASAATAMAATVIPCHAQSTPPPAGPFKLDPLPYAAESLEPHIDAMTMGIHHSKHHQAYVNNLNTALAAHPGLQKKSLEELCGGLSFLPQDIQKAVQNNGGGHWNHRLFWSLMGKPGAAGVGVEPPAGTSLATAIDKTFSGMAKFKEKFAEAAMKRFGSGWAWLIVKEDGSIAVVSTANQDNPLMQGIVPNTDRGAAVLALDVWEHAYYLKYQNKRADYITAWWNVVNWTKAEALFSAAQSGKK